jgi:excisionase family DNA binding protein
MTMPNRPTRQLSDDHYLRAGQVAELLHVSPKTVFRWAKEGRLPFIKTLGGHRRYSERAIRELAGQHTHPATDGPAAGGGTP